MNSPAADTVRPPPAGPIPIGRNALKVWQLIIFAIVVLGAVALATGEEPFTIVPVALAASGWLLAAAPGVVFLAHTIKHRDQSLERSVRRSATGSGIVLIVLGAMACILEQSTRGLMMPIDVGIFRVLGFVWIALGAVVLLRAWTARTVPLGEPERFVFRHRGPTTMGLILAFLAMVMLPKFSGGSMSAAYRTVLRSDLYNLVTAQEAYFADSGRFATTVESLRGFRASSDVSVPAIAVADTGWSATNSISAMPGLICGVAVNTTNPVDEYAASGEPVCR